MAAKRSRSSDTIARDNIEKCAYAIWEHQGKPQGHDIEHWLQAEAEVAAKKRTSPKKRGASKGVVRKAVKP